MHLDRPERRDKSNTLVGATRHAQTPDLDGLTPRESWVDSLLILGMKPADRAASNSLLSQDRQELDELFERARLGAHRTASPETSKDAVRRPKNQKQIRAGLIAKPRIADDTSPEKNLWKARVRHTQEEKLRKLRPKTGTRQQRPQTEEGYRVYSLEELAADQPAGLELSGPCPFDCNCCFY